MEKTWQGHAAASFVILVWGSTFVVTKVLLRSFSPTEILAIRFALAAVILLPAGRGTFRLYGLRTELRLAGAGLAGITAYYLAENGALAATDSVNVGLIVAVIPLLTAAASRLAATGEALRRSFWMGLAVAGAGVVLVVLNGRVLRLNPLGDLLAFGAALSFAVYSVLMRGVGDGIPPLAAVLRTFAWGLVGALPFLVAERRVAVPPSVWTRFAEPFVLPSFLFLSALASAVAYALWNRAIAILGAVRANTYVYTVPLVNAALSAAFLGERVTLLAAIGGILIILGVAADGLVPNGRSRPPRTGSSAKAGS